MISSPDRPPPAWLIFAAFAAITFTVGYAGLSHAFDRRQSAAFCTGVSASRLPAGSNPIVQTFQGLITNSSTTTSGHIICPIHDDNDLRAFMVNQLNVHGRDDVTTAQAGVQACMTPAFGTSTSRVCGTQAVTGNAFFGDFTLRPDLSVWRSRTSDFAYLYVILPQTGASNSQLRGWWTSN
jgi:hypothetical protein